MSNKIQKYVASVTTGTTITSAVYIDKYDQLQFYVPNVGSTFGSAVVACTLLGSPDDSLSYKQMNYWDYVNKTPASCVVTISTGGVYEFPYPGAMNNVQVQFDVAATNTTACYFIAPKTTY